MFWARFSGSPPDAAVARPDVQAAVGAEHEVAAVVVRVRLVDARSTDARSTGARACRSSCSGRPCVSPFVSV